MNCEEASLLIEEFYDGEMDSQSKSRLEEHLSVCQSCGLKLERMMRLDYLLEQSSMPPPVSAQLGQTLMAAFRNQHEKVAPPLNWWQRIFVGSVMIPKPVFAAIMLAIALAVLAVSIRDDERGAPSPVSTNIAVSSPAASTPPLPEVIEKTKIVEVPVVRERVVTRVVYVERKGSERVAQNPLRGNKQQRKAKEDNVNLVNLAMSGAVEDGEYVTRANLAGFQPIAEMKTRMIPKR